MPGHRGPCGHRGLHRHADRADRVRRGEGPDERGEDRARVQVRQRVRAHRRAARQWAGERGAAGLAHVRVRRVGSGVRVRRLRPSGRGQGPDRPDRRTWRGPSLMREDPSPVQYATEPLTSRVLGPERLEVTRQVRPTPEPGEVLIAVRRAGVCGTDVHIIEGSYPLATYPLTLGHELSGTVVEVGEDVENVGVGDRVTADPNVPCLACEECRRNAFNHCADMRIVGVNADGGFASYVTVQERAVYPVGDLSFGAAALGEPLGGALWEFKRSRFEPVGRAIVFGAGPMGCLLVRLVRFSGASSVVAGDLVGHRLEVARDLGTTE